VVDGEVIEVDRAPLAIRPPQDAVPDRAAEARAVEHGEPERPQPEGRPIDRCEVAGATVVHELDRRAHRPEDVDVVLRGAVEDHGVLSREPLDEAPARALAAELEPVAVGLLLQLVEEVLVGRELVELELERWHDEAAAAR
jgi:hypothetical protein